MHTHPSGVCCFANDFWSGSHGQKIQLVEDHRYLQLGTQGTTKLPLVSGVISSWWSSVIFKHGAYQHQKSFQKNLKFKDLQNQMRFCSNT